MSKVEERVASTSVQGAFPTAGAHLSDISADCDGQLITVHALAADGRVIASQSALASASGFVDITWSPAIADASIYRPARGHHPTDRRPHRKREHHRLPQHRFDPDCPGRRRLGRLSTSGSAAVTGTELDRHRGCHHRLSPLDSDHGDRIALSRPRARPVSDLRDLDRSQPCRRRRAVVASVTGQRQRPSPATSDRNREQGLRCPGTDHRHQVAAQQTAGPTGAISQTPPPPTTPIADSDYGYQLRRGRHRHQRRRDGRKPPRPATGVVAGTSATIASASISGTTTVGQTLTASAGTTGGTPAPTVPTCGSAPATAAPVGPISSPAPPAASYVLVAADADKLRPGRGHREQPSSGPPPQPPPPRPRSSAPPSTIASAQHSPSTTTVGQTSPLPAGATTGDPSPTVSHQWQRSATAPAAGRHHRRHQQHLRARQRRLQQLPARQVCHRQQRDGQRLSQLLGLRQDLLRPPRRSPLASISGTTTVRSRPSPPPPAPPPAIPARTGDPKWQRSSNGTSGWADITGATSSTYTSGRGRLQQLPPRRRHCHQRRRQRLQPTPPPPRRSRALPPRSPPPVSPAPSPWVRPSPLSLRRHHRQSRARRCHHKRQRSSHGTSGWSDITGATSSTYTSGRSRLQQVRPRCCYRHQRQSVAPPPTPRLRPRLPAVAPPWPRSRSTQT